MIFGLVFGYLFDAGFLKQFIIPVTFVMVYPMMVTLNVKTIFKGRDLKLQTATQIINFIFVPLLAFFVGKLFLSGQDPNYGLWAVGLFLIGVLPTSDNGSFNPDLWLKKIRGPNMENRIIVTAGDPVDEITRIAEKGGFDLIIMGTHGHTEFEKMMLGSTASGVMSKSRVPVLVARPS